MLKFAGISIHGNVPIVKTFVKFYKSEILTKQKHNFITVDCTSIKIGINKPVCGCKAMSQM